LANPDAKSVMPDLSETEIKARGFAPFGDWYLLGDAFALAMTEAPRRTQGARDDTRAPGLIERF
jgi:hypothetical protein